jgi:hypothetical protein
MVTYLTFRVKYCPQPAQPDPMNSSLSLLYRIHVFNFLFSLFTLATGYVEVTRTIVNKGSFSVLYSLELISLIMAHIVVMVYLCCPKKVMSEEMIESNHRVNQQI